MNATSSELLMRNFNEIFIELDPIKRATLLAEYCAYDCLWVHPGDRIVGREGINEAAAEIRKHFPEYRYTVTSEIQTMHNVATCRWEVGCQVSRFTTQERTSWRSAMATFQDAQPREISQWTMECAFVWKLNNGGVTSDRCHESLVAILKWLS